MLVFNSKSQAKKYFLKYISNKHNQSVIDNWVNGGTFNPESYKIEFVRNCYGERWVISKYVGGMFDKYI